MNKTFVSSGTRSRCLYSLPPAAVVLRRETPKGAVRERDVDRCLMSLLGKNTVWLKPLFCGISPRMSLLRRFTLHPTHGVHKRYMRGAHSGAREEGCAKVPGILTRISHVASRPIQGGAHGAPEGGTWSTRICRSHCFLFSLCEGCCSPSFDT